VLTRFPQIVPLTGFGLVGAGVVWGVHDVTNGTCRWFIPYATRDQYTWKHSLARWVGSFTGISAVILYREYWRPPMVPKWPPLNWAEANALQTISLTYRTIERTLRDFPYRHRLMTVVAAGIASGVLASLGEYYVLAKDHPNRAELQARQTAEAVEKRVQEEAAAKAKEASSSQVAEPPSAFRRAASKASDVASDLASRAWSQVRDKVLPPKADEAPVTTSTPVDVFGQLPDADPSSVETPLEFAPPANLAPARTLLDEDRS
jgi:hypothetical protein